MLGGAKQKVAFCAIRMDAVDHVVGDLQALQCCREMLPFPGIRIKELHSIVARDVELMPIEEKRGDGITLYRALDDKFEVLGAISLDRVGGNNPHHIFSVYMARVVIAVLLHHLGEPGDGSVVFFVILIQVCYREKEDSSLLVFQDFFDVLVCAVDTNSFEIAIGLV